VSHFIEWPVYARRLGGFMKEDSQSDYELKFGILGEGSEGEDDLEKPSLQRLSEAVVTGTDWTTETILRQLERGNIKLDPQFQRRDAWRAQRKSKFIESLVVGQFENRGVLNSEIALKTE
jgi:hypothetical protein